MRPLYLRRGVSPTAKIRASGTARRAGAALPRRGICRASPTLKFGRAVGNPAGLSTAGLLDGIFQKRSVKLVGQSPWGDGGRAWAGLPDRDGPAPKKGGRRVPAG